MIEEELRNIIIAESESSEKHNPIFDSAAENISSVRLESLRMVNLIKNCQIMSEGDIEKEVEDNCRLNSFKIKPKSIGTLPSYHQKQLKGQQASKMQQVIWNSERVERGGCCVDQLEKVKKRVVLELGVEQQRSNLNRNGNYFLSVIVHDSIRRKKMTELVCGLGETFESIFKKIHCVISKVDPYPFRRFTLLGDRIITDDPSPVPSSDVKSSIFLLLVIIEERKKLNLATYLHYMGTTRLCDIPIPFGKVCIYRDLPKCDHILFFKDLFRDDCLGMADPSRFPLQIYYPRISRRTCQICEVKFARIITRRDKLSPYSINFYCKTCYEDLHIEYQ